MSNPGHTRAGGLRPRFTTLPDGRLQMVTLEKLAHGSQLTSDRVVAWGGLYSAIEKVTCTGRQAHLAGLRLVGGQEAQQLPGSGDWVWVREYEELPATGEVQVGGLRRVTDENGRDVLEASFISLASATEVVGVTGTTTAPGRADAVLGNERSESDGAVRRTVRRYVEAGDVEEQVGGDTWGTDENNRRTLDRAYVQLASAAFSPGVVGVASITVSAVTYALTTETSPADAVVRRISRRWTQATAAEQQVGGDTFGKDANGRRTLGRRFFQLASAAFVEGTTGSSITAGGSTFALGTVEKSESAAIRTIERNYIEATTTLTQVGVDIITREEDGGETREATFVQLRTGSTYTPPAPGDAYGSTGCVFSTEVEGGDVAVRTVKRRYIKVTSTLREIGSPVLGVAFDTGIQTSGTTDYVITRQYAVLTANVASFLVRLTPPAMYDPVFTTAPIVDQGIKPQSTTSILTRVFAMVPSAYSEWDDMAISLPGVERDALSIDDDFPFRSQAVVEPMPVLIERAFFLSNPERIRMIPEFRPVDKDGNRTTVLNSDSVPTSDEYIAYVSGSRFLVDRCSIHRWQGDIWERRTVKFRAR